MDIMVRQDEHPLQFLFDQLHNTLFMSRIVIIKLNILFFQLLLL